MTIIVNPEFQEFASNGDPLSGGKLYAYEAGSTTPKDTYSDSALTTPNANPVILDSAGRATVFGSGTYRLILKDSDDVQIWDRDNVVGIESASSSSSQWTAPGHTPTYVSATSFTVSGDKTTTYQAGRRFKAITTAGAVYGTLVSSAYTSLTTITVVCDSGSLDSGLSQVDLGLLTPDNYSTPYHNDRLVRTVTPGSDANYTLSAIELAADVLVLDLSNWTTDRSIICDDANRKFTVINPSTNDYTATITTDGSSPTTVDIPPDGMQYQVSTRQGEGVKSGVSSAHIIVQKRTGVTQGRRITKSSAGAIDIDAGILPNYNSATGFDPTTDNDGTITSLSIGDDIYIYYADGEIVASYNNDGVSGANDSLLLGGFHYGKIRPISEAYNALASLSTEIIENSIWDQFVRPKCNPTGMVEIIPGVEWLDIYLASEVSGSWPDTIIGSVYNAVPLTGSEGYNRYYDYIRLARNVGKRLPSYPSAIVAAYGTPEGATGNTARQNTGDHSGYGFEAVSCLNIDQPSGNVYQSLIEIYDRCTADAWRDGLNTGKDSGEQHGEWNGCELKHPLFGGGWDNAAEAGSRSLSLLGAPWSVDTKGGLRAACDSI